MMLIGYCTNPDCHRKYTGDNYAEIVTLRQLGDGEMNYFVISLCTTCYKIITDTMVHRSLKDAVIYEVNENDKSIVLTRDQKNAFKMKQLHSELLGWGRSREEVDKKALKL